MENSDTLKRSKVFFICMSVITITLVIVAFFIPKIIGKLSVEQIQNEKEEYAIFLGIFALLGGMFLIVILSAILLHLIIPCLIMTIIGIVMANKNKEAAIALNWGNIGLLGIPYVIVSVALMLSFSVVPALVGAAILAVWILDIIATVKFGKELKKLEEIKNADVKSNSEKIIEGEKVDTPDENVDVSSNENVIEEEKTDTHDDNSSL